MDKKLKKLTQSEIIQLKQAVTYILQQCQISQYEHILPQPLSNLNQTYFRALVSQIYTNTTTLQNLAHNTIKIIDELINKIGQNDNIKNQLDYIIHKNKQIELQLEDLQEDNLHLWKNNQELCSNVEDLQDQIKSNKIKIQQLWQALQNEKDKNSFEKYSLQTQIQSLRKQSLQRLNQQKLEWQLQMEKQINELGSNNKTLKKQLQFTQQQLHKAYQQLRISTKLIPPQILHTQSQTNKEDDQTKHASIQQIKLYQIHSSLKLDLKAVGIEQFNHHLEQTPYKKIQQLEDDHLLFQKDFGFYNVQNDHLGKEVIPVKQIDNQYIYHETPCKIDMEQLNNQKVQLVSIKYIANKDNTNYNLIEKQDQKNWKVSQDSQIVKKKQKYLSRKSENCQKMSRIKYLRSVLSIPDEEATLLKKTQKKYGTNKQSILANSKSKFSNKVVNINNTNKLLRTPS